METVAGGWRAEAAAGRIGRGRGSQGGGRGRERGCGHGRGGHGVISEHEGLIGKLPPALQLPLAECGWDIVSKETVLLVTSSQKRNMLRSTGQRDYEKHS